MPGYDGTGPLGGGPRTGGGFGNCAPYAGPAYPAAAYPHPGVGRGGYPRGGGRGWARGGGRGRGVYAYPPAPYYPAAPAAPGAELDYLRSQEKGLGEDLNSIRQRISDLEKASPPAND